MTNNKKDKVMLSLWLEKSEVDVLNTAKQGFRVTSGLIRLVGEIVVEAMRRQEK